jgi:hypothetical protein
MVIIFVFTRIYCGAFYGKCVRSKFQSTIESIDLCFLKWMKNIATKLMIFHFGELG